MIINQFVEKLIFQIINLNVHYESQFFEQFFESSFIFEQFDNTFRNIIHRKFFRKFVLYSQKTAKKNFKIKKSFVVFQLLNFRFDVNYNNKLNYILKKIKHQND